MAVFRVVYVFAALASIFTVCSQVVAVLTGRAKITDHMFDGKILLVFLAVGLCTVWDTWYSLRNSVPDGSYNVHVAVWCNMWDADQYLPATLFVSTDTDYDRSQPSTNTTYTITEITFPGGRSEYVDVNAQPGTPVASDINGVECIVTLPDISSKTLGITPGDNWNHSSFIEKICMVGVPLLCTAGLVQGLVLDEKMRK